MIAALVGAAAIAAATSFFMYRSYEEARHLFREQHLDQQALTTRQTALALREAFHLIEHELVTLAHDPAVRSADPPEARAAMERTFAAVRDKMVNDISRANAAGVIEDTLNSPGLVGRDFSFRSYYQALHDGNQGPVYEFITFQGVRKGRKGIIVAGPILGRRGEFSGPLVFVVEIGDLLEQLLTDLPSGMQGWVVDADGVILYHPALPIGNRISDQRPAEPAFAEFVGSLQTRPAAQSAYRAAGAPGRTLATGYAVEVAGERLVLVLETPEALVERSLRDFKTDTILGNGLSLAALLTTLMAIIVVIAKGKRELEREIRVREAAEAKIQESEARFGQLIEHSPMAMALVDAGDNIVYVNRKFRESLGFTCEMIGTAELWFKAAYPDESYRRLQIERWRRYKERARSARGEVRPSLYSVTDHSGAVHTMELYGALIGDKHLIMYNDVTERSRLEHQLRHAQKMESFGRLAGGVAHDFNNILTAIIGYGEMLGDRLGRDSPLKAYVDTILHSSASAARLTSSLLAFSRRQVLHPRFIDVAEHLRGVQRLLERIVGEDIAIGLEVAGLKEGVVADPAQLEQVLMNLAANARDAMPEGGMIQLSAAAVDIDGARAAELDAPRTGRYVRISFCDTGVGMDAETLEHIFEPFYTTKDTGKGTGLGLAIVYGIVSQHRGFLAVRSAPGEGTTFEIHLPAAPAPAADERTVDEFSSERLPRGSGRVLLVEDDQVVRVTLAQILRGAGYEVVEARQGAEALALLDAGGPFDLAVLDVVMPGVSGVEVFRGLRDRAPGIRVLFLSGYAQERLREDILADPKVAFLPKPATRRKILEALDELGNRPSAGHAHP